LCVEKIYLRRTNKFSQRKNKRKKNVIMTTKHHFVLTKKEPELIAFITSLPKGERSKTVVKILAEALEDRVATIPMNFNVEPSAQNMHTKFSLPDDLVEKFCKKFGRKKGTVAPTIKTVLINCIAKNLVRQEKWKLPSETFDSAFQRMFKRDGDKYEALLDDKEKYRKMLKEHKRSFLLMKDTLYIERKTKNE